MENTQIKQSNIIKNVMQVAPKHCENCGSKYSQEDFKVMRNTSINTLLHLKCASCGNTYMLNVVSPINGMVGASRIPLNLDLENAEEISKFAGKTSITEDIALDIYEKTDPENFDEFLKSLS